MGEQSEADKDTTPQAEPVDYFEQNVSLVEEMASAVGENSVRKANWRAANKGEAARGWKGHLSLQVEVSSGAEHVDDVLKLISKGAIVMGMRTRSLRKERARAEAAERELAQARADTLVLAGLLHFDAAPGLADISAEALATASGAAASLPDTEVLAVIRRALGGAA